MAGKNSWLLPLAVGVGIGWFFSNTLSTVFNPIASRFGITGGHAAYAYPGEMAPHALGHPYPFERRSFDRSYDSWLHTTVNAIPTQA